MDFEPLFQKRVHPGIARAAQYCQDLARDHPLPHRHDFRPTSVRSIIGYVFLIDVLQEQNDYHFSLFGVHMPVLYGVDLTNKRLSEIEDENMRTFFRKTYDTVIATRSFLYMSGRYAWKDQSVDVERLLVPMADDQDRLTTIFGVTIPSLPADTLLFFTGFGAPKLEINDVIDAGV